MEIIVDRRLGNFGNERCHRDFDVEFYHVGYRVELDVDNLIFEGHEADEHQLGDVSLRSNSVQWW